NLKNARICKIREYEELDNTVLPDERYAMRLAFYDQNQLREEKKEFDRQMEAFTREIFRIWDVAHAHYESKKRFRSIKDFNDLCERLMNKEWRRAKKDEENDPNHVLWNEIGELYNENSFVEKNNRTYEDRILNLKNKLTYCSEMLQKMHGYQNPVERVVIDERINFIIRRFNEFTYKVNPHHIQPGLVLDVDIVTIKRKQYMLKGMANVLNEFLYGVSKGFQDQAFASYSRRRSTVRSDIEQSFEVEEVKEDLFEAAYKEMHGAADVKGSVDLSPKSKPKKTSGLKEL
ncbi:MAG TPA: cytoplasmic filament protein CfpA, partial [Spirochaetota bacterium]|nr:cytoplasmic filament protein CfpA [Spirochaetota bacterium]